MYKVEVELKKKRISSFWERSLCWFFFGDRLHARRHARRYARTHARARACVRARAHARTHTHTHTHTHSHWFTSKKNNNWDDMWWLYYALCFFFFFFIDRFLQTTCILITKGETSSRNGRFFWSRDEIGKDWCIYITPSWLAGFIQQLV